MAAAILGLAALLHTSALAFQIFKYLGVAYLLYMAWSTLRERGAMRVEKEPDARSALQIAVTGVLINILNPKLSIFFLAFLPQFVSADELHPLALMLTLSAVFMVMTFVVFVGYGLFAARFATTSSRGRGCWRGCGGFLPARLLRSAPLALRPLAFLLQHHCVCVTIAASLPSPRVILVCQTMVVRPRCSGVHSA